jgi:hypothetical protein
MRMTHFSTLLLAGCLTIAAAAIGAVPAGAQSIGDRVARVTNGTVRMSFATLPDVCGNGNNVHRGPSRNNSWGDGRYSRDIEWDRGCDYGPGRVVLDVRDKEIVALRFYVGGRWRQGDASVTDLGTVPARAAADYLVHLAATLPGKAGREAVFPATVADSSEVWPALLKIARDDTRPHETRKNAVFWVGQAAGEAATAGLNQLISDDVDREIAESAVFALSQRPHEEGVPALIKVARSHKDPEIRKKALFWLGQSDDPRALALFEEILLAKKK